MSKNLSHFVLRPVTPALTIRSLRQAGRTLRQCLAKTFRCVSWRLSFCEQQPTSANLFGKARSRQTLIGESFVRHMFCCPAACLQASTCLSVIVVQNKHVVAKHIVQHVCRQKVLGKNGWRQMYHSAKTHFGEYLFRQTSFGNIRART